jgi:anti-sigma B factor antagonist
MTSEIFISEEKLDDAVKVTVSGEVDIYTSQKLKDRLYSIIDTAQSDLKIDCRNLNYIDSTGLGIFVATLKKAKQYSRSIHLYNLKESIKKLFLITGLDKLFIIE